MWKVMQFWRSVSSFEVYASGQKTSAFILNPLLVRSEGTTPFWGKLQRRSNYCDWGALLGGGGEVFQLANTYPPGLL